ncbi:three-prime repair exonuclease 1-like [Aricia agestis]|uniref:three-prime repair exonuclease 1-like n=1 Tax=Aricia agestis TaxID=91739 RepID=UPI001C204AD0|nr:three-prime repair exonuclease 1-like [Aricia agestis]
MYIETFVFFDIETTGLPHHERNQTKITELSLVAVSRKDMEVTLQGRLPCVNKLSLLFNPQRRIQAEVVKITGLSNSTLQNQQTFNCRIKSINSFLDNLPKPVCLVAHNGNIFDYKILRAEYIDANETLPSNIYCVDSLVGLRKILKETNISYNTLYFKDNIEEYFTDDEDEWPELNTSIEEWQEIDELVCKMSNVSQNDSHNKQNIKTDKATREKVCCTLAALYKRLLNKDAVEAHRAEVDCIMLLECVLAVKSYFLEWADSNCKLIDQIKPLIRK